MTSVRKQLQNNLRKDKAYRNAFVCEHVDQNIPFQIRANREHRGWSQADLGRRARMAQARISVLEDPNYSKFTISTLKRLAAAFDTGLQVAFVPVSTIMNRSVNLANHLVSPPADEDSGLDEEIEDKSDVAGGVLHAFERGSAVSTMTQTHNVTITSNLYHQLNSSGCMGGQFYGSRPAALSFGIATAASSPRLGTAMAVLARPVLMRSEAHEWNY